MSDNDKRDYTRLKLQDIRQTVTQWKPPQLFTWSECVEAHIAEEFKEETGLRQNSHLNELKTKYRDQILSDISY